LAKAMRGCSFFRRMRPSAIRSPSFSHPMSSSTSNHAQPPGPPLALWHRAPRSPHCAPSRWRRRRSGMPAPSVLAGVRVAIHSAALCPFYSARRIRGVKVGPSPDWLRTRLEAIGIRSINNIVRCHQLRDDGDGPSRFMPLMKRGLPMARLMSARRPTANPSTPSTEAFTSSLRPIW